MRGLGPKHDPNQKPGMHKHDPNNPDGEMSPDDLSREVNAAVDGVLEDLEQFESGWTYQTRKQTDAFD